MTQAIASFNFVNTDHLVHLRDLKIISDQYSLNIVDATHKLRAGQLSWVDAQKKLAQARLTVKEKWAAHPTDDFVGEELKLVTNIEAAFAKLEEPLNKLQGLFEKEDTESLAAFVEKELYEDIDNVLEQLSMFIDAQLVEANSEFEAAEANFEFNRNLTVGIVLAGLLGSLWLALSIIRSITQPLAQVQKVVGDIEKTGNFSLRIDVQQSDEVGRMAQAINRMIEAQQSAVTEVNLVVTALAAGNFTPRIQADLKGDLAEMKGAVNNSADAIQGTTRSLMDLMLALENGHFSQQFKSNAQGEYQAAMTQATNAMHALDNMLGDVTSVLQQNQRCAHGNQGRLCCLRFEHGGLRRFNQLLNRFRHKFRNKTQPCHHRMLQRQPDALPGTGTIYPRKIQVPGNELQGLDNTCLAISQCSVEIKNQEPVCHIESLNFCAMQSGSLALLSPPITSAPQP
jgi:methyl-accepting chemotaxis protein